jgi:predicted nucleic acid-binding protein
VSLVVDASVAVKWFVADELLAAQALAIVQNREVLIAPDLVIAEVCNAAWRSARLGRLSSAQVSEIAAVLPNFFDRLVAARELAARAVVLATAINHPVYDCLYLALAEAQQIELITADDQMLRKLADTPWQRRVRRLTDYRAGQ